MCGKWKGRFKHVCVKCGKEDYACVCVCVASLVCVQSESQECFLPQRVILSRYVYVCISLPSVFLRGAVGCY